MTMIVSSKAEFEAAKAEADKFGMRLAFVIVKALGVFEVTYRPLSEFNDYSTGAAS